MVDVLVVVASGEACRTTSRKQREESEEGSRKDEESRGERTEGRSEAMMANEVPSGGELCEKTLEVS